MVVMSLSDLFGIKIRSKKDAINLLFFLLLFGALVYLGIESQTAPEEEDLAQTAIWLCFSGIGGITILHIARPKGEGWIKLLEVSDVDREVWVMAISGLSQLLTSVLFAVPLAIFLPPHSLLSNPVDSLMLFTAQALGEDLFFSGILTKGIEHILGSKGFAMLIPASLFAVFHSYSYMGVPLYLGIGAVLSHPRVFASVFFTQLIRSYVVLQTGNVVGVGLGHVFMNWIIAGAGLG